jgi:putative FmdB family regulatory protein
VPIYEYRCRNGHEFEVFQRMSDDPVELCEQCTSPVERLFRPVAIHFKGSGFYSTDYGRGKKKAAEGASSEGDSKSSDGESKPSKDEAKAGSSSPKSDD